MYNVQAVCDSDCRCMILRFTYIKRHRYFVFMIELSHQALGSGPVAPFKCLHDKVACKICIPKYRNAWVDAFK